MREVPLVMPKSSMTMTEGTFLVWHRAAGDAIKAGDVVCEIASDKVDMEVESPIEGTLLRLVAEPDQVLQVGEPLAFISTDSDDMLEGLFDDAPTAPAADQPAADQPAADQPAAQPAAAVAVASPPSRRGPRPAVPFARRRASELHVEIESVNGSGPSGLITVRDVEAAAAKTTTNGAAAAPTPTEPAPAAPTPQPVVDHGDNQFSAFGDTVVEKLSRISKISRPALTRSWTTIPHVTQHDTADITDLDAYRRELDVAAKAAGYRITLLAFTLKAVVSTLKAHPAQQLPVGCPGLPRAEALYHIGVAVDTEQGLVVPVIKDVDRKGITELSKDLAEVSARARDGKLTGDDVSGASFTISSLGGFGGTAFTPPSTVPRPRSWACPRVGSSPFGTASNSPPG